MFKYGGPKYVRGGIYCSVTLPEEFITTLQAKLCAVKNVCFNC